MELPQKISHSFRRDAISNFGNSDEYDKDAAEELWRMETRSEFHSSRTMTTDDPRPQDDGRGSFGCKSD